MREYTILITVEDYIDLSDEDAITVTEFVSDVHGRDVEILEVEEA